jgi:flagellar biogenesis protein FliO
MFKRLWMPSVAIIWLLPAGGLIAQTETPTAESPALKPRAAENRAATGQAEAFSTATTTVGALALVLGVFFVAVWLLRRNSPAVLGGLPPEAFEILGRRRLDARHQAQLVRCGGKLLLICAGANGVSTLTEITDPAEVRRLEELCRQGRPNGFGPRRAASRGEERDE